MAIGNDRVQPAKFESSSEGGDDADTGLHRNPVKISPQEDAIESAGHYFQDEANRDENVYVYREGDDLKFRDVNNPDAITLSILGGGISGHENLDTLVHNLAETSFLEVIRNSNNQVTSHIAWTDSTKVKKVRELTITRLSGRTSVVAEIQYDSDGDEASRLTETITRVNGMYSTSSVVKT